MNQTVAFKVGSTDYSSHVVAGTYNVNDFDIYNSRETGNKTERRKFLRTRVMGTFDMWFKDKTTYDSFVTALKNAKQSDLTVSVTVTPNNTDTVKTCSCFVEFAPVRNIDGRWRDYMEQFEVTIKEA